MSAAPKYTPDMGYAGLRMTAEQYLALGETRDRYELIDGMIVMSPSPTPGHSEIAVEIAFQLKTFARTSGCRVFADTDVRFDPRSVYRPDVSVYGAGRLTGRTTRLIDPPDLVVEVLSPRTRGLDLVTKRHDYERFGVGEYWIIDPDTAGIRGYRRLSPGAPFDEFAAEGDSLPCTALPGFTLDLRPLRTLAAG